MSSEELDKLIISAIHNKITETGCRSGMELFMADKFRRVYGKTEAILILNKTLYDSLCENYEVDCINNVKSTIGFFEIRPDESINGAILKFYNE